MSDASADVSNDADDVPCAPLFATETMAELSARQGRRADAVSIYRHLLREGGSDPAAVERWRSRLAELEGGPASASPKGPTAPAPPKVPPLPTHPRSSLFIREPVRSGQVIYADGRDLIVLGAVHSGAQLLADGHIHVYGALKGRAIAGARGQRDAQVFCLALEAELVGVDTGFVVSDDFPESVQGCPARIFLTPEGTCTVVALPAGKPLAARSPLLARLR